MAKSKITNQTTDDEQRSLRYMRDPSKWVTTPCPLKRINPADPRGLPETGYLIDDKPVVYLGNIFATRPDDKKAEYSDHESIVRNGWRVD